MLIISYDFHNDKVRAKFAKFIKKFGRKLQYSVYEVKNSQRILQNILNEIELVYEKQFGEADSILIFSMCEACKKKVIRYGAALYEDEELVIF